MKINKKQLQEMIIAMINEDDFDVPADWQDFDDFEFSGAAKDAAKSDIEASGEKFDDIGKNKFEKGMNQKDFSSKVSQANLNLPSDEAELSDIKKTMKAKQAALDNVAKYGMSLNESEERRQLLAGITKTPKLFENHNIVETIQEYVSDAEEMGYAVALMDENNELVDDYVDPSDYPDMMVIKSSVIAPEQYRGYTVKLHSGGMVDDKNVKKSIDFKSKYDQ